LADYSERWDWITGNMAPAYGLLGPAARQLWIDKPLQNLANRTRSGDLRIDWAVAGIEAILAGLTI